MLNENDFTHTHDNRVPNPVYISTWNYKSPVLTNFIGKVQEWQTYTNVSWNVQLALDTDIIEVYSLTLGGQ